MLGTDGARLRADAFADDGDLRADDATPDKASDLRAITSSERASDRRADRVPRRSYHGSVRRLRVHRGLGVRLALLRGDRLCVLPHVRRDVRSVLHGGGARAGADGGVGIELSPPWWKRNGVSGGRVQNCYLDYAPLVVRNPANLIVTDNLFLGSSTIVLAAQTERFEVRNVIVTNNIHHTGNTARRLIASTM